MLVPIIKNKAKNPDYSVLFNDDNILKFKYIIENSPQLISH